MLTLLNSVISIVFLATAFALTFLMFYLWKFPYDKTTHKSMAPRTLVTVHRLLGYLYILIYLYLMWQMVPRLWAYQIELPARSVVHLALGMSIAALLIIKIVIVRFFKHLEAKLVPFLGTALLLCTIVLIFLALPFSLREAYLNRAALDSSDTVTMERIARVREQLPKAGFEDVAIIDELASRESLNNGRQVLVTKCTQCHDLRTALARPRTPDSWRQTVSRMANRSTVLNPIDERDQMEVTAYLIAISPTLQSTLAQRRHQAMEAVKSQQAGVDMADHMKAADGETEFDPVTAKSLFEDRCSQCHASTQIERTPPENRSQAIELIQRMIGNGLIITENEVGQITEYIIHRYVQNSIEPTVDEKTTVAHTTDQPPAINDTVLTGKSLYQQYNCVGCHGVNGKTPIAPNYPRLAGLGENYLARQITDIRDGLRVNGLSAVMQGSIIGITDDEISMIAQYLSGLEN